MWNLPVQILFQAQFSACAKMPKWSTSRIWLMWIFGTERALAKINDLEIGKSLKNLKESKLMGPDQIHPMNLKECVLEFAKALAILVREPIKQGKIPNWWRLANISPIFKIEHRTLRSNYRPLYPWLQLIQRYSRE